MRVTAVAARARPCETLSLRASSSGVRVCARPDASRARRVLPEGARYARVCHGRVRQTDAEWRERHRLQSESLSWPRVACGEPTPRSGCRYRAEERADE